MLKLLSVCLLTAVVHAHSNKVQSEADLQEALMPQELNPAFTPNKDGPWKAIIPLSRLRRSTEIQEPNPTTIADQVKQYSRVIACVVLAVSAVIEIVIYVLEVYANNST